MIIGCGGGAHWGGECELKADELLFSPSTVAHNTQIALALN